MGGVIFKKNFVFDYQLKKVPMLPYYLLSLPCLRRKRNPFFADKPIALFRKSVTIIKPFLFYKFLIHAGRSKKIFINSSRNIGFCFGEFFIMRRFGRGSVIHFKKKKKTKK